jgi:uncharacterized protein YicC (UPF0701 family)
MTRSLEKAGMLAVLLVLGVGSAQAATPAQGRAVMQACKTDVQSLCKGVQSGGGHIMACLKQHADSLSEPCKAELQKHMPPAP